jgi:hypothetical protein
MTLCQPGPIFFDLVACVSAGLGVNASPEWQARKLKRSKEICACLSTQRHLLYLGASNNCLFFSPDRGAGLSLQCSLRHGITGAWFF